MARSSTTFKKGHKSKGRRKGFEIEDGQLKRMNKILDRMLFLTEKILDGKADFKDQMKYEGLQRTFLKIMDKLHANKEAKKELEISGGFSLTELFEQSKKENE